MKDPKGPPPDFTELRRQAEQRLRQQTVDPEELSAEECIRLIHELQVHQVELEMQNEELRRAQVQLAESRDRYANLYDFAPVGYLTLEASGKIVEANLTGASLLGVERGRLIGSFLPHYLGTSDRRRLHQLLKRLPDQQEQRLDVSITTGGVDRIMLLNMLFIGDTRERMLCRVSFTDVTELKRTQEELRLHKEELDELVTERTAELFQVKEQFRETKEHLEAVFQAAPLGIGVFDAEGRVVTANAASERIFGWPLAEIRGQIVPSIPQDNAADSLALLQQVLQGENLAGIEIKQQRRDGALIDVSISAAPMHDPEGNIRGFVGLVEDITGRKQVQEALQTQARVLASMAEGVTVTDDHGQIVYTNPAFDQMFGYEPGELPGQHTNILNAYPPDENVAVVKDILQRLKTIGTWHGEFYNRKKDGSYFYTAAHISILEVAGKKLYISVQEDVTARKATEQEMARLASFPELNPNPVLEIDFNGGVRYCNPAGLQVLASLGAPGEPWRFLPPDWKDLVEGSRASGDSQFYREVEINGGVFAETISSVSEPEAMRLYVWDITKRRQALVALSQSEERYRSLFQNNHAVMLLIDPGSGDIVDANPAACAYYGFPLEELKAKKITEINTLTEDQALTEMQLAKAEERRQFYFRHRLAGGEIRDVEVYSGPIIMGEKELLYSIVHDITERTRLEAEVAMKAKLLDLSRDSIFVVDPEGNFYYVNEAAYHTRGYSREELLNIHLVDLDTPEQAEFIPARTRMIQEKGEASFESAHRRKDGSVMPVEVYVKQIRMDGRVVILSSVRDITTRFQAEEALWRSNQRLDLLAETASELLASDSPQEVVNSLCQKVMTFLDCDVFFNFLADAEEGRLNLNTYAGITDGEARRIKRINYGAGLCGYTAREGRQIVAEDIATTLDPRTELIKSYGIQAYACHPLKVNDRVLGTLAFGTRGRPRFSMDELALMNAVADQVAIALDRKQATEALRQERDFSSALLNTVGALVVVLDREGRVVRFNQACELSTGYGFAEVEGKFFFDIFLLPEEKAGVQEVFGRLGSGDFPLNYENYWRTRSGEKRLISWSNTTLPDSDGAVAYIIGTGIDVTRQRRAEEALRRAHDELERRVASRTQQLRHTVDKLLQEIAERERAEVKLRESEARFAAFMRHLPGSAIMRDRKGRFVFVNESWEKTLGRRPGESLGKTVDDFWPSEIAHQLKEFDREVILQNRPMESEVELLVGGKPRTFLTYRFPIRGETGQVEMVGAIGIDITDRLKAEEARDRLIEILEATPDFVGSADREGRLFYLNRAAREMLGLTATNDITFLSFLDTQPPWAVDLILSEGQTTYAREGFWQGKTAILCRDGLEIPVSQVILAHRGPDGKVKFFSTICRDISDMKRAEENLKRSEEKLRFLTTQLLTAQEDERKRLAAELHDELGHALLTLKLHLTTVERHLLPAQADLKEKMRDIVAYLTDTVEEVRRLYHDLSPGDLEDLGLTTALRNMMEDFQELYEDIDWSVELADIDKLFPLPIQTMIYRIVQEALTNIGKHAYPEHVNVKVTQEDQKAVFVITDDGRGFSMDDVLDGDPGRKGMGLAAMAQRVSLVGGIFDLWSRENQGARIIFSIPFTPAGERL